jgi:hypothetical protein
MHRARKERMPFSAFSLASVLPDGQFILYAYESPEAILIQSGLARVLKPRFYTAGYEAIGESTGTLRMGDAIIICSDGVTQSGLGQGMPFGIGSEGIALFLNRGSRAVGDFAGIPENIVDLCLDLSLGQYRDDTTLALLRCREAKRLTILTGPPSKLHMDREYVREFMGAPGKKAICGSSTIDIVSRETKKPVKLISRGVSFGSPPEYAIEGVDLATEGAILLNQALNILDEPEELFVENNAVERFCVMLLEADAIHFMVGNAINDAHETLLFKQIGMRIRRTAVNLITRKLKSFGKLVMEKEY